jgi:RimJ/RimL family protein N-acetyltransferase
MEPEVAAVMGVSGPMSPDESEAYVIQAIQARDEGRSYVFVLTDRGEVTGVCRLIGVRGVPRLIVATARSQRGKGNGSFLVERVLEFAFQHLELEQVTASGACLQLVSQFGTLSREDGQVLRRADWLAARASVIKPSP